MNHALDPVTLDTALERLIAAVWRQAARDMTSRHHHLRHAAAAWLDTPDCALWARLYDPVIDPEAVISAMRVAAIGRLPYAHRGRSRRPAVTLAS